MRVISNTAISLDGKITTPRHEAVTLGSPRDRRLMGEIRNQADAVLVGGNTFRNLPDPLVPASKTEKKLWNVIVTRSLHLEFTPAFLNEERIRPLVLTSRPDIPSDFPVETAVCGGPLTPAWIISELEGRGVKTLLLEAGGELIYRFLEAGFVDEMYVTLCPKLIGGRDTPSLVGGAGFDAGHIKELSPMEHRVVGDEIFLHYRVKRAAT